MGQSSAVSKEKLSIKLSKGQEKQIADALGVMAAVYGPLLAQWRALSAKERAEVLAHSPLLARAVALFGGTYGD